MPPKNAFWSKHAKKNTKKEPVSSVEPSDSEFKISTDSSSELFVKTTKGKAVQKRKAAEKTYGKKVITQGSKSPPKHPRRKNPSVYPPDKPQPANDDDDDESNIEEVSSK